MLQKHFKSCYQDTSQRLRDTAIVQTRLVLKPYITTREIGEIDDTGN
jgi:hypothetical protein